MGLEAEMNSRSQKIAINAQLIISGATATAIVVLALLVGLGTINPRNFAIGCIAVISISAIVWFLVLKGRSSEDAQSATSSSRFVQNIGKRHLLIAGVLVWLVVSFWITRGGPWVPRLVGASVLLLLLLALVVRKPR